jgi:hypothetical protein
MLLLSEGQTGQAWEPSKALLFLGKVGSVEYKIILLSIIQRNNEERIAVTTGGYSFGYKPFS